MIGPIWRNTWRGAASKSEPCNFTDNCRFSIPAVLDPTDAVNPFQLDFAINSKVTAVTAKLTDDARANADRLPTDMTLANELRTCRAKVRDASRAHFPLDAYTLVCVGPAKLLKSALAPFGPKVIIKKPAELE